MKSLIHKLQSFNLNEIESQIYLHLQGKPAQTVVEISKSLEIPRSSIYDNTSKLIEKGLLEKIILYKSQKFKAYPLSILENIIDKHKAHITKLEEDLEFLNSHLPKSNIQSLTTEVKYYQGSQGLRQMMWNVLNAKQETIGYSIFGRKEIVGSKFNDRWITEFKNRKLKDRVIANPESETIQYIQKNISSHSLQMDTNGIRILPKEQLYISGDTTIYNNTFSVCYWKNGEIVGVEIINPELVKTQKTIFESLWQIAKPL